MQIEWSHSLDFEAMPSNANETVLPPFPGRLSAECFIANADLRS